MSYYIFMLSIIVAYEKNNGIGAKNDIPWMGKLPADIEHFRTTTKDAAVIMGWITYKSIGRLLPKRQNIIISDYADTVVEGATVAGSLQEAIKLADPSKKTFVIGGGTIYAQAIDLADEIIASEINATFLECTVFFPKIDKTVWKETSRKHISANKENLYNFDIVTYKKYISA